MTEPKWIAVDEVGNDNFATSIYESGHKGLLVARCNQNGQYPWQASSIIRGLEANKAVPGRMIAENLIGLIDDLRADEGDSVTLLCDNPEGPPNNAVECNGDWTDWKDRRFAGESLLDALSAAWLERSQYKAALAHGKDNGALRAAKLHDTITNAELVILLAHEQGCSNYIGEGDMLCGLECADPEEPCECLRIVHLLRDAIESNATIQPLSSTDQ